MLLHLRYGSTQTIGCAALLRSFRSSFLPHSVTAYWHPANQSQCWPCSTRHLARKQLEYQFSSQWYGSTWKKIHSKNENQTPICRSQGRCLTTRPVRLSNLLAVQRGGPPEVPPSKSLTKNSRNCYIQKSKNPNPNKAPLIYCTFLD